jgi:sortase A
MRPDEPQNRSLNLPARQPQSASVSSVQPNMEPRKQEAASNIVRSQIETIYNEPAQEATSQHRQPSDDQWKYYHSAWQNYYQQYYERYYTTYIHHAKEALEAHAATTPTPVETKPIEQPAILGSHKVEEQHEQPIDKDEALYDLHNRLVGNVQNAAVKVRKSRHFVPITAAICVMLLFGFLQYNQLLIANVKAYISPGDIDPQNIIVDPTMSVTVDPTSTQLVIPKINVDVPVDYNAKSDYDSQMASMKNGLAYFGIPGADSKPGQVGNTPIAGHSSNDVLDTGNYKFIFAQLDKLQVGDSIYANYQGVRYTYVVTQKNIVLPTDVSKLVYDTDKPILTLITCTPLGTSQKRLLITAEQINPSPTKAAPAPTKTTPTTNTPAMAGTSPTFFEQLFGAH